jgi:catalase
MSDNGRKRLTTNHGEPVENDLNSKTAGKRGPLLMQDIHFLEKLAHFDRERIPERVVHAKGAGAWGTFRVTGDVTEYTKANFLSQIGKETEVFVRFSTVGGEKGSADSERDPRGFAVKFYTEDGNYDMVGNNTPVFFIRDPLKFPDFIHTQKRNPRTNLKDPNIFWDFLSLTPESIHQVTILFSDRGTPLSYRHMHGFSSHTFKWYNEKGEYFWVKYHFKTKQGIENLTGEEAQRLAGEDPDSATRDLFAAIEDGNFPTWRVCVQIIPADEAEALGIDLFDVTKVVPHAKYPLVEIGEMELNRNPENYFAEVEQAAFSPGNLVPGIATSPDKMLQGRLFSYHDTHRHRVGTNHHLIPVNRARNADTANYQRDGFMQTGDGGGRGPNYWPNSFGGPEPDPAGGEIPFEVHGEAGRHEFDHPNDDFVQAGDLYRKAMTDRDRENLVRNIVGHLGGALERIQYRQTAIFFKADQEYGSRVASGLELDVGRVRELAAMSQDERRDATTEEAWSSMRSRETTGAGAN